MTHLRQAESTTIRKSRLVQFRFITRCRLKRHTPPYTRARIVSGPFFLAVSLGKCAEVLRVTLGQNTLISLFSAPEPSLFSVWPAGRLRRGANKINNLHAPVRCQPRRAIRLQTREHSLVSRDQHNTIQTAFSHKLSINRIVAKRLLTNQPLKPES